MQFKFDENMPDELTEIFLVAGHEVETVADEGLEGASDAEIAAVCQNEGRTVLSLDKDFCDTRVFPPKLYSGLVVFRPRFQSRENMIVLGNLLISTLQFRSPVGQLWIVHETRIRFRE